jgi:hypothetical protein
VRATGQASGGPDKECFHAIQSSEDERCCPELLLRQEILRLTAQDDRGCAHDDEGGRLLMTTE